MEGDVDHMIAEHLFFPSIVIQGQAETRYGPGELHPRIQGCGRGEKGILDLRPCEFSQMQTPVPNNIRVVIKMLGCIKGVGIGQDNKKEEHSSGEEVSSAG